MNHSTPRRGFVYTRPVSVNHPAVVQAAQYVSCVFEPNNLVEIRVLRSVDGKVIAVESKFQVASKVPEIIGQIAVMKGNDVWPAIGVLRRKTRGETTDADAAYSRFVFVDYDAADFDAFRQRLAGTLPPPTMEIISGHGLHIYWGGRADRSWRVHVRASGVGRRVRMRPERLQSRPGHAASWVSQFEGESGSFLQGDRSAS